MVLSGACLSRSKERVELNWSRYVSTSFAGEWMRDEESMSLEKAAEFIQRKERTVLVVRDGLV